MFAVKGGVVVNGGLECNGCLQGTMHTILTQHLNLKIYMQLNKFIEWLYLYKSMYMYIYVIEIEFLIVILVHFEPTN